MEDEQQKHPQDYFYDTNIEERMAAMSDEEMIRILRNLEETEFWVAMLRYNQKRLSVSQQSLFAGDPIKEPTNMARNQGIMLGISDLQNAVIMLVQESQREARESEQVKEKKD